MAIIDCPHYRPAVVAQMVSPIIKSDLSLKPEQLCCIASTATELPSSSFSYNQLFRTRNHTSQQCYGTMQEMYATVVSRCMEISKHDKDTKIFMKIRGEYITLHTLEKYGHHAAKYHSDKVVYCNHLIAISCVPGYSV